MIRIYENFKYVSFNCQSLVQKGTQLVLITQKVLIIAIFQNYKQIAKIIRISILVIIERKC